jgi:hypothetical protein
MTRSVGHLVDETTATGVSYVLIIGDDREDGAAEPIPVSGFRLMGEYHVQIDR